MQDCVTYKLILRNEIFEIPSKFDRLFDIDQIIYNELTTNGQYKVKSDVDSYIFKSFLRHWTNNEPPKISSYNILEYEELSQEFDRMKDLISLYYRNTITPDKISPKWKNDKLITKKDKKSNTLNEITSKYQLIIQYLFNNEGFDSHSEFIKYKYELLNACKTGNAKLVDFLTRKKIKHENGFIFILNEKEKTASLFRIYKKQIKSKLIIPRSIYLNSQEYLIIEILENSFRRARSIKSIQFSEDSELKTIDKNAFNFSNMSEIEIPSSVTELKEGWCQNLDRLFFVNVCECKQKNIKNFNKPFILGKSDPKSDIFDVFHFAIREVYNVVIPPSITIISPYAFYMCKNVRIIEFSENSQLKIIGKFAFSKSDIVIFNVPPHVTEICDNAFESCEHLTKIEFSENSELKIIGNDAFSNTSIEEVSIPNSVEKN